MTHAERYQRRKAAAGYAVEHGLAAAAAKFGVSIGTVRQALEEHGVVPKKRFGSTAKTSSFQILMDLLMGVAPIEVAKKYNLSRQRIDQLKTRALEAGFPVATGVDNTV